MQILYHSLISALTQTVLTYQVNESICRILPSSCMATSARGDMEINFFSFSVWLCCFVRGWECKSVRSIGQFPYLLHLKTNLKTLFVCYTFGVGEGRDRRYFLSNPAQTQIPSLCHRLIPQISLSISNGSIFSSSALCGVPSGSQYFFYAQIDTHTHQSSEKYNLSGCLVLDIQKASIPSIHILTRTHARMHARKQGKRELFLKNNVTLQEFQIY